MTLRLVLQWVCAPLRTVYCMHAPVTVTSVDLLEPRLSVASSTSAPRRHNLEGVESVRFVVEGDPSASVEHDAPDIACACALPSR